MTLTKDIKQSTLFIRYIYNLDELEYIENNYDHILSVLKKYNNENDIIFIANSDLSSDTIHIYNVPIDKNDTVARNPIKKNKYLNDYFQAVNHPNKEENILFFELKKKKQYLSIKKRFFNKLKYFFRKKYHHSKVY